MPELLFKLNNVPDDEAMAVRRLLEENKIDCYETSGGNWGISVAAIWLRDGSQLERAQQLLAAYQQERQRQGRAEYLAKDARGERVTMWQKLCANPLQVIALTVLALAILYLSIAPFLAFGNQ